jgi:phosphotransferase system  glucose/maltose/N-acetylglucosamine-specific IIC component
VPSLFTKETFSNVLGNVILFLIICTFIIGGFVKKVNVFDAFIEGAKQGWDVIIKVIPYLVGLLVAIRVFRDSGALEAIINAITWCFTAGSERRVRSCIACCHHAPIQRWWGKRIDA